MMLDTLVANTEEMQLLSSDCLHNSASPSARRVCILFLAAGTWTLFSGGRIYQVPNLLPLLKTCEVQNIYFHRGEGLIVFWFSFHVCLLCHRKINNIVLWQSGVGISCKQSVCRSGILMLCCVSMTCEVQKIECDKERSLPTEFVWRQEWVQRRRNMRLLLTVEINR